MKLFRQLRTQRSESGQSLAEYALILVLVAVVAIVALFAIGLATQRDLGIVTGSLGARKSSGSLTITDAECAIQTSGDGSPQTSIYVIGTTTIPTGNLRGSADVNKGIAVSQVKNLMETSVFDTGGGTFRWNPTISDKAADFSLCPQAVVIQSKDGTIATAPLTKVSYP